MSIRAKKSFKLYKTKKIYIYIYRKQRNTKDYKQFVSFNFNNHYTKINALFIYEEPGKINRFDFTKDYNEVVEIDNTL